MSSGAVFRPNVRLIIVRRFAHAAKANIYAAYLRENDIDCFISNSNTGTLIPFVEGGFPFLLHISETDLPEALELLAEMDEKGAKRLDQDYRDADFSDIEYEKTLSEYEERINRGSGKQLVWALLLIALGIAMVFAFKKGLRYYDNKPAIGLLDAVRG